MKVVIDIDEKDFAMCIRREASLTASIAESCIANGTVLPKGHGSLIDADAYFSEINRVFPCNDRDDINIRRATAICISGAPILIDADK